MAGSDGPVADARRKFNQYRHVIDELNKGKREAIIVFAASRISDEVHITASARVAAEISARRPQLRLAHFVEESVEYTGRNGLKFHHNVVRTMPSGVEGVALDGGKIRVEHKIGLAAVRTA